MIMFGQSRGQLHHVACEHWFKSAWQVAVTSEAPGEFGNCREMRPFDDAVSMVSIPRTVKGNSEYMT
jgi:hypothetical protein